MAARYAVTTGNWTGAIWAATAGGAAGSAAVPVNTDDATLGSAGTFTVVAATDIFTAGATHNLVVGDDIRFFTSGTLPAPLDKDTTYYVIADTLAGTTFKVSTTPGGSAVDITSTGSGTHYFTARTVTLDQTGCVCQSLVINGHLTCTTSANWDLKVERGITQDGTCTLDMSGTTAYSGTLIFNNSNTNGTYSWRVSAIRSCILKGTPRKRWTLTQSALTLNVSKTVDVDDASGWVAGDILVFATTQAYNSTPKTDVVTISSITAIGGGAYSGTGPATINWTDGLGTTGAVQYSHDNDCIVGNFTSNLTIKGSSTQSTTTGCAFTLEENTTHTGYTREFDNVTFVGLATGNVYYDNGLGVVGSFGDTNSGVGPWVGITDCAMYNSRYGLSFIQHATPLIVDGLVYYDSISAAYYLSSYAAIGHPGQSGSYAKTIKNCVVFRAAAGGIYASFPAQLGTTLENNYVSACSGYVSGGTLFTGITLPLITDATDQHVWSCKYGFNAQTAENLSGGSCGTLYSGATNTYDFYCFTLADATIEDASFPTTITFNSLTGLTPDSKIKIVNKNADVTNQEIHQAYGQIKRNNSTVYRATSSISIKPTTASQNITRELRIPCADGQTVRVIGYARRDNAGLTVTVSLTGTIAGVTLTPPANFSSSATDTWQQFDLSITNNAGADGSVTLTYTANSSGTTYTAYFSGVPDTPFITKCRHYGFTFNESSSIRTVDTLSSANEATASGYDYGTFTWGASASSTAIDTDVTFQQLYDWHQYQACLNIASVVALTGAGVAGSPALFASGNVTIATTKKLSGGGSISMGSYTLTSDSPWAYTYTGGTFSQATTVPTFSGGTLTLGAEATYVFSASSLIIELTPSTAGVTYDLTGGTFSGTIYLKNLTAHAINVSKAADPTFDTSLNVGGVITLIAPTLNQSVVLSGLSTTCRIQLYDTASATELYNAEPGSTSFTWTDPAVATAERPIRLRITDYLGATAKAMVDRNIGTCGLTEGTASISFANAFNEDDDYNAQAAALGIVGADITDIEIDDTLNRVKFNFLAGGDYDARRIYMYMVYWLDTEAGIRDDFVFCSPLDPVNLPMQGVLFENVTAPQEIITFINAYVYDAATGRAKDLIVGDGINFAPDHVVQVIATIGGANIITGDIADVAAEVQAGLTSQGLTTTRAAKLDNLDQKVSRLLVSTIATR